MINTTSSLYAHNLSITEKENPWKRDDEDAIKQGCITFRCCEKYLLLQEKRQGRKMCLKLIILYDYQIDFRMLKGDKSRVVCMFFLWN